MLIQTVSSYFLVLVVGMLGAHSKIQKTSTCHQGVQEVTGPR